MKFAILIFVIFGCIHARAQQKEVDVLTDLKENNITFNVVNFTDTRQEVTLEIDTINLSGYEKAITKLDSARDTVSFTTLFFKNGEEWQYSTNYTYRPKPTDNKIRVGQANLRRELLQSLGHTDTAITIFVAEDCARSEYATKFLKRNKIPFQSLEVSSDNFYERVMWQLVKLEEPDIEVVQFPVFLVGDTIAYNIENLKGYNTSLPR